MNLLKNNQIISRLFPKAKSNTKFIHCFPSHRDDKFTFKIIDDKNSTIFEQAEKRLHVQKAVITMLMRQS